MRTERNLFFKNYHLESVSVLSIDAAPNDFKHCIDCPEGHAATIPDIRPILVSNLAIVSRYIVCHHTQQKKAVSDKVKVHALHPLSGGTKLSLSVNDFFSSNVLYEPINEINQRIDQIQAGRGSPDGATSAVITSGPANDGRNQPKN